MRSCNVIISIFLLVACSSKKDTSINGFELKGATQGTTYTIIIAEDSLRFQQTEIDHLLADFDTILSTYIPESAISKINTAHLSYTFTDTHGFFKTCYELSQHVYYDSEGLFDPSIYPLIHAWGFFNKSEQVPSQHTIDSLRQLISFEPGKLHSVSFKQNQVTITKKDARFKLDFNAIAQGYSVDVLSDFIASKGHTNYYIEIGGEVRVRGKNRSNENWNIGIDVPDEIEERDAIATLHETNCGIATSGNYRNYFEKDGKKYGHIVSPVTGYPVLSDVLSATVLHKNAALADAYATVFMLIGKQKTIEYLKQHNSIHVVLVYMDEKEKMNVYRSKQPTIKSL